MNAYGDRRSLDRQGAWRVVARRVEPGLGDLWSGASRAGRVEGFGFKGLRRDRGGGVDGRPFATPESGGPWGLFLYGGDDRYADRVGHGAVRREEDGRQPTFDRQALGVGRAHEQEDQDRENGEHSSRV